MVFVSVFESLGGMSACYRQRWDILCHDAASLYNGTFAYRDAAEYRNIGANPYVVTYDDIFFHDSFVVGKFCPFIVVE